MSECERMQMLEDCCWRVCKASYCCTQWSCSASSSTELRSMGSFSQLSITRVMEAQGTCSGRKQEREGSRKAVGERGKYWGGKERKKTSRNDGMIEWVQIWNAKGKKPAQGKNTQSWIEKDFMLRKTECMRMSLFSCVCVVLRVCKHKKAYRKSF